MIFRSSRSTAWVESAQADVTAQQLAFQILQKEMHPSDLDAMKNTSHSKHKGTWEACVILFALYAIGHLFREIFRAQKAREAWRATARLISIVPVYRLWRAIGYHIGLRVATMPAGLIRLAN
jgi:hypothetical protein